MIDPAYLLLTEEKVRRFRWCVEGLVLWKAVRLAREELGYEELGSIKHFEMVPSAGQAKSEIEKSEVDDNWWEFKNRFAERHLVHECKGKKPKVDDAEAEAVKEREKQYWRVAIKPELWLLEELAYEP